MVLWSLGLLALLTTQLVGTARSGAQSAAARRDQAILAAAAAGGIQQGIHWLLTVPDDPALVSFPARIGVAMVTVTVENQAGRINPNQATLPLLQALLVALGESTAVARTIAEGVVDWRTAAAMSVAGELKAKAYAAAGRTYAPPGRLFHSIEEMGLIPGMTPALLDRMRPHICLYLDTAVTRDAATGPVAKAIASLDEDEVFFPGAERIFAITAEARGFGQLRVVRRAIVRFRPHSAGLPAILTWERE